MRANRDAPSVHALEGLLHAHQAHLDNILEEREKRFLDLLQAERAYRADAVTALTKQMDISFAAADRAVAKAEQAQREYNARSNEFRAQIDDQQKTLMPRAETANLVKSIEDKITVLEHTIEDKITATQGIFEERLKQAQVSLEKATQRNMDDISSLRESRSAVEGRRVGGSELLAALVAVALVLATLLIALGPKLLH